jgi:hypothetical protein
MIDYILSTGPLSICIDASNWATYTGGILSSCGQEANHCVQLVGVNLTEGSWKVRQLLNIYVVSIVMVLYTYTLQFYYNCVVVWFWLGTKYLG